MKILHIIVGLNIGGAENFLRRLILAHKGNPNYCHSVISLTTIGAVGENLQNEGVEITALGLNRLNFLIILIKLIKQIKVINPDVVQTWMYHSDFFGGIAARLSGKRNVIWSIRCSDFTALASITTKILIKLNSLLSKIIPKKIFVNSNSGLQDHIRLGFDMSKLYFIPNGYDLEHFSPKNSKNNGLLNEYNIGESDVVIGHIGRFHSMKDHFGFIQAIGIIKNEIPNFKIIMIGKNIDWENTILSNWIKNTGIENKFILLGECQNMVNYLAMMDIFCSSSSASEGFPNVLAESMAMGIPCVVTNVGDSADILGEHGIIVSPKNPSALAQGILKLIKTSTQDRHLIGAKARQKIMNEYSIKKVVSIYETHYKQIVGI